MIAKVIRNQDDSLGYKALAGAQSDGMPIGSIISLYSNVIPAGFLPCTGVEFDTEQFAALYVLLGSNRTPDLRECNLVGVGQSTREAIAVHDVYTVGQFKDDQMQTVGNGSLTAGTETDDPIGAVYSTTLDGNETPYRNGGTTHGKQVGVNYAIKATTGVTTIGDPDIYNQIVAYVDDHYIKFDVEAIANGNLIKYDAATNKFIPITPPTENNTVLSAVIESTNDWTFQNSKYDAEMQSITNEDTPTSYVRIGRMTTNNYTIRSEEHQYLYQTGNVYFNAGLVISQPLDNSHVNSTTDLNTNVVVYNDELYTKIGDDYYKVVGTNATELITEPVTDSTVITALNELTPAPLYYVDILYRDFGLVTAFTTTGLTSESVIDAALYDVPISDFLPVYCNTYFATDYDYEWEHLSDTKGIAFIGTEAEYEDAKLIAENEDGYIPSDSSVILTDKNNYVKAADAEFTITGYLKSGSNYYETNEDGVPVIENSEYKPITPEAGYAYIDNKDLSATVTIFTDDVPETVTKKITSIYTAMIGGIPKPAIEGQTIYTTGSSPSTVHVYMPITGIDFNTGVISFDPSFNTTVRNLEYRDIGINDFNYYVND